MIVWIDLETTGLDPKKCEILEYAFVLTDDDLTVVNKCNGIVKEQDTLYDPVRVIKPTLDLSVIDPFVVDMHSKSGLWTDWRRAPINGHGYAKETLGRFLGSAQTKLRQRTGTSDVMLLPAGSSVQFDMSFIEHHWPDLMSCFHYRHLDVSTLKETAARFDRDAYDNRPGKNDADKAHRASIDVMASIEEYRYYLTCWGLMSPPEPKPKAIEPQAVDIRPAKD